jgi:hypothetical protein
MKLRILWTALLLSALLATSASANPNKVEGRVVHATQGEILLERAIEPGRGADYERLGFRRVKSLKEVGDRTILGENIYVLYLVNTEYSITFRPANVEGRGVTLELERDRSGHPYVAHVGVKS